MTFVQGLTIALRWTALAFACWNLRWSLRGACEIARGHVTPLALYLSVVFGFALVVVSFWAAWMFGATPAWRLLSYVLLAVTMWLAAYGHKIGTTMHARQFYALYDHLGVAVAIADLARVDADQAARVAEECRVLTAAALVARDG